MEKLYEGKAKALFQTEVEDELLVEYSNQATAFNGEKKANIKGKGELNNQITALIYQWLAQNGIETHFVKLIDETKQIVKKVTILPVEVVIRNKVAGSLAKKVGVEEGTLLQHPTVEFYLKDDSLGDPFLNSSQLSALGIITHQESEQLGQLALQINQVLIELFHSIEIDLIDIKFEFGRTKEGKIILADEISPDTCRLWDINTQKKLDKDNFRRDLGEIVPVYQVVFDRLKTKIK